MDHDFVGQQDVHRYCPTDTSHTCTKVGGIMDYNHDPPTDKWTCCSNYDFAVLYNKLGSAFCLTPVEGKNKYCPNLLFFSKIIF